MVRNMNTGMSTPPVCSPAGNSCGEKDATLHSLTISLIKVAAEIDGTCDRTQRKLSNDNDPKGEQCSEMPSSLVSRLNVLMDILTNVRNTMYQIESTVGESD